MSNLLYSFFDHLDHQSFQIHHQNNYHHCNIFLVNGGNAGDSSGSSIRTYHGLGGNTKSVTNVACSPGETFTYYVGLGATTLDPDIYDGSYYKGIDGKSMYAASAISRTTAHRRPHRKPFCQVGRGKRKSPGGGGWV